MPTVAELPAPAETVVPTEAVDMIEAEVEAAGPAGDVSSIISAGLVNRSETHSNMVNNNKP